jgi:phospho-2-dehydro-3-deoxyheptonate aldolase
VMEEIPASEAQMDFVQRAREAAGRIITGEDDRLLVVVGPCSVHDPKAGIAGLLMTQSLPFVEQRFLDTYERFERAAYRQASA